MSGIEQAEKLLCRLSVEDFGLSVCVDIVLSGEDGEWKIRSGLVYKLMLIPFSRLQNEWRKVCEGKASMITGAKADRAADIT